MRDKNDWSELTGMSDNTHRFYQDVVPVILDKADEYDLDCGAMITFTAFLFNMACMETELTNDEFDIVLKTVKNSYERLLQSIKE